MNIDRSYFPPEILNRATIAERRVPNPRALRVPRGGVFGADADTVTMDGNEALKVVLARYQQLVAQFASLSTAITATGQMPSCAIQRAHNEAVAAYRKWGQVIFDQIVQQGKHVAQVPLDANGQPQLTATGESRVLLVDAPLMPPTFSTECTSGVLAGTNLGVPMLIPLIALVVVAAAGTGYVLDKISVLMHGYVPPSSSEVVKAAVDCFNALTAKGVAADKAAAQCPGLATAPLTAGGLGFFGWLGILVTLAGVGFGGWYLWKRYKRSRPQLTGAHAELRARARYAARQGLVGAPFNETFDESDNMIDTYAE